jgi:hypothetical protein
LARVIYIGGYGRSGSTMLERLFTANAEVVACGEVTRHLRRIKSAKICSCGRRMKLCPVWSPFRHKLNSLEGWEHRRLTLAMLNHVSRDFSVMVDSSKTAWGSALMPFRLCHDLGGDFLLVHLVRDPRGVCWSTVRTLRRRKEGGSEFSRYLRTIFGWMFANLVCEAFGLIYPKQYLRLRYEDVVGAPEDVLAPVLRKVALSQSSLESLAKYDNCHQLHGNRMRFKRISVTNLKQDLAWKAKISRPSRRFILALSWPLAVRYGYLRSSRAQLERSPHAEREESGA